MSDVVMQGWLVKKALSGRASWKKRCVLRSVMSSHGLAPSAASSSNSVCPCPHPAFFIQSPCLRPPIPSYIILTNTQLTYHEKTDSKAKGTLKLEHDMEVTVANSGNHKYVWNEIEARAEARGDRAQSWERESYDATAVMPWSQEPHRRLLPPPRTQHHSSSTPPGSSLFFFQPSYHTGIPIASS